MRTACLGLLILLSGCSAIVDSELNNTSGDAGPGDAGPGGMACDSNEQCVALDPFNCNVVCSDEGFCVPDRTPDGTECGTDDDEICVEGTCAPSVCGDGYIDRFAIPPEHCDDGNGTDGDGCDSDPSPMRPDCRKPCVAPATPDCMDDGDPCSGMEMCIMAMGYCAATPALDNGTPCTVGGVEGECYLGICDPDD